MPHFIFVSKKKCNQKSKVFFHLFSVMKSTCPKRNSRYGWCSNRNWFLYLNCINEKLNEFIGCVDCSIYIYISCYFKVDCDGRLWFCFRLSRRHEIRIKWFSWKLFWWAHGRVSKNRWAGERVLAFVFIFINVFGSQFASETFFWDLLIDPWLREAF